MPTLSIGCSATLIDVATCLNWFRMASPGLYCCVHATVELSTNHTVTPGVVLMVNHGRLKTASPEPDYQVFRGAPNLIADVFASEDDAEYQRRRQLFASAGVGEYLAVFDTDPITWHWHAHSTDAGNQITADDDGILRSRVFPGLWIPEDALARRDWWTIMATITRGVTRRGHHDLMETIWHPEGT